MGDYQNFIPEIFVALAAMGLLLFGTFYDKPSRKISAHLIITAGACLAVLGTAWMTADSFAKLLVIGATGLSLLLAPAYLKNIGKDKPEYPVLMLLAMLGMMLMIAATDFLIFYVGLELQNIALYILVSFHRDDNKSQEAGMKYFILGAISSAILLFGVSLLYGVNGSTSMNVMDATQQDHLLFAVGYAFFLVGVAFKLSAAPFHIWVPDIYEGAPTPVTNFLMVAPKIAAIVFLVRLMESPLAAFFESYNGVNPLLLCLAIGSMAVGSFGGLGQTNIKRLMGYSAITNIGIILVGLSCLDKAEGAQSGLTAVFLYLVLYFVGTLGIFSVLIALKKDNKPVQEISDLGGLFKTHPALGLSLVISLLSVAGLPPLAGFFGKYFIFLSAIQSGQFALTFLGVLASVVAAAYYLRVIKTIVFTEPTQNPLSCCETRTPTIIAIGSAFLLVVFVVMPSPLMNAAQQAAINLLSN